jgi:GT2 family glycosyltransferase
MKLVTVVIPTCNRPEDLKRLLEALVRERAALPSELGAEVEILVGDDGTGSETGPIVEENFDRRVSRYIGPRRGPGPNRNAGAARAQGEWLLFVDDDCIPAEGFLRAYLDAIETARAPIFEGRTSPDRDFPNLEWEAPVNETGGHLPSCNFAVKRSVFDALNGFDERYFPAMEDMEFRARATAAGYSISFVKEARVIHPIRRKPPPRKMAARWEPRVIQAYDFGATAWTILWRLPWHVLCIQRHTLWESTSTSITTRALGALAIEWLWVVAQTPGWILKWRKRPRSAFWAERLRAGEAIHPKFGF